MSEACAVASRHRGEPVHGTASRARRWVLLEHPGAWGPDAIRGSRLPVHVVERLTSWQRDLPARILLVRRPGGGRTRGGLRFFAGVSAPGGSWLEEFRLDEPGDVVDIDLEPLRGGVSVGGRPVTRPRYLVCTNGRHDVCCARDGIPVARSLHTSLGDRVWECSHVGGDRFAGNLVCLPDGQFYGHLDPASADRAVAAHEDGRILLEHWRGRSCHPFAVQAAESLVRGRLGIDDDAGLGVVDSQVEGPRVAVRFRRRDGGEVVATVQVTATAPLERLTCAGAPSPVPAYHLEELVVQ